MGRSLTCLPLLAGLFFAMPVAIGQSLLSAGTDQDAKPIISEFAAGMAAYEKGDYVAARRIWDKIAREGNGNAAHNIGIMYLYGQGVNQSDEHAFNWFKFSADYGDVNGQVRTADMYDTGKGVETSEALAKDYFLKAAAQGNAEAYNRLGMIAFGDGHQDQAAEYYQTAAEKGWTEALENLTVLYGSEYLGYFDAEKAIYWGRQADAKGSATARSLLARLYEKGYGTADDKAGAREKMISAAIGGAVISHDSLTEDEWEYVRSEQVRIASEEAANDDPHGHWKLGEHYWYGSGIEQSFEKAVYHYQKAFDGGDPNAYEALGKAYLTGQGVERDETKGIEYLLHSAGLGQYAAVSKLMTVGVAAYSEDADYAVSFPIFDGLAKLGQVDAYYLLAMHYKYGRGIAQNQQEAERLLELAAQNGNPFAAYSLGLDAEFLDEFAEAKRLYQIAADAGYAQGYSGLAGLYAKGAGVPEDRLKAAELYKKSAELHDVAAAQGADMAATWASEARSSERFMRDLQAQETARLNAPISNAERDRRAAEWKQKERQRRVIEENAARKRAEDESRPCPGCGMETKITGWRSWLVNFAGGGGSGVGYSPSSSGYSSYSNSSSSSGYNDPFGGLNSWDSEYQTQQAISNPISYYQNTYSY